MTTPLAERWRRWGRRINALSLRERVIMAASAAAALAALVDAFVLSPQFSAQRTIVQKLRADAAELNRLRAELAAPMADTPQTRARRELTQLQAALAEVDRAIDSKLAGRGDPAALPELLQRVLRRHERLTLIRLDTVPPPAGAGTAQTPAAAGAAAARRSVEVQLSGRYADLQAYAAEIERDLPGLRWASLHIDGQRQPPLMSARVWLAGGGS